MKFPKHSSTNFRRVAPFLAAVNASGGYVKIKNEPYMPLVLENLESTDGNGFPIYSVSHYGVQNGDAMADPDMEIAVDWAGGHVIPLTFRNDYMGIYQEVFFSENGERRYYPRLLSDLDEFLRQWLVNIENQGFKPVPKESASEN